jgi:hypothetical protein
MGKAEGAFTSYLQREREEGKRIKCSERRERRRVSIAVESDGASFDALRLGHASM